MSTIRVPIVEITNIRPHSNPEVERLEVATVEGWQLVVGKGLYQEGQKVAYFEQGTVVSSELAESLGVTPYLSNKTDIDGNKVLVVHRVKLKGEPSFGMTAPVPDEFLDAPLGTNLADYFGAKKYMPPIKFTVADAAPAHPMFPKFTDIENMRNFPHIFEDGEMVVMTEKVHGTNVRVGWVRNDEESRLEIMAGSRTLRRKMPEGWNDGKTLANNVYWYPWSLDSVWSLLNRIDEENHRQVVLYGEVFGPKIQNYDYGVKGLSFRAFDLMIDGEYVPFSTMQNLLSAYGVPMVPVLYYGPFSLEAIQARSNGESLVGGTHGREGGVVRPAHQERHHETVGRVILKYVGDSYLFNKNNDKNDTTDV